MNRPLFTKATIGRIQAMQDNGLTNKEIAAAIGTTEGSLAARSSQLGLSRNPINPTDKRVRVHFPQWVIEKCIPHAARRDLSPTELIKLMTDRIVQDNLFEAVLDDGIS